MKKTVILFIASLFFITPEFTQAATTANETTISVKKETGKGRKKKNGSYRKKKGFLKGLFKGKSQCDCPKH